MKQLTCEICGSTSIIKQDGVYICQSCNTRYSIEDAKKLMNDITNNTSGNIVNSNNSQESSNLWELARRAHSANDHSNAGIYYSKILLLEPNSWEANFYSTYHTALCCTIAELRASAIKITNNEKITINLIKQHVEPNLWNKIANILYNDLINATNVMINGAINFFTDTPYSIKGKQIRDLESKAAAIYSMINTYSNLVVDLLGNDAQSIVLNCNKALVNYYGYMAKYLVGVIFKCRYEGQSHGSGPFAYTGDIPSVRDIYLNLYSVQVDKVRQMDPSFQAETIKKGGCYVATCIYGSYNCPQVWTLRRYRDYTLAKTWYGRAFIKTYYAISPTIVKHFGNTKWFKKLWKGKLDKMVSNLQAKGFESTPYNDIDW